MKHPKHIILLSILMLLIGYSCAKSDEDTSFIYNLEEEFLLRPMEKLSTSGSQLTLVVSSLQPNPCDNSEIVYQYSQTNGISTIALNDITKPENCNTTEDPPSIRLTISPNSQNTRQLNVVIKDIIENTGQIDELNDRYQVRMNSTDGIRISHSELLKIQPTTVWGGIDYENTVDQDIANSFMTELSDLTKAKDLYHGYYGQFELLPTGEMEIWNDPKTKAFRSAFALETNMTLAEIAEMVEDYRSSYPDIRFFAYNAFGQSL